MEKHLNFIKNRQGKRNAQSYMQVTAVWQHGRCSAPQTHLWLIKVCFSASTFVVKIATFAKPETVIGHCNGRHFNQQTDDN
jgi:hypothetical protein